MAITSWLVRGDCHGNFDWVDRISTDEYVAAETAIVILGDAGLNFYLNKTDTKKKMELEETGLNFYLVQGNHEQRPELLEGIELVYDEDTCGFCYVEPAFPHIRYFKNGEIYKLNEFDVLVLGGAYSVDKWYRLERAGLDINAPEEKIMKRAGWFPHEELTEEEQNEIFEKIKDKEVDFIFSHTAPVSVEPVDLFLSFVDQSKVSKRMENWLEKIKTTVDWKIWCFGHYHQDRMERPRIEQYFNDIEDMQTIWHRWYGKKTIEVEWWLAKSPNYYMN